jgi:hypothetical protein
MIPMIDYLSAQDLSDALRATGIENLPAPELLGASVVRCNEAVLYALRRLESASQMDRDRQLEFVKAISKQSSELCELLTSFFPENWGIDPDLPALAAAQVVRLLEGVKQVELHTLLGGLGDFNTGCSAEDELAGIMIAIARLQNVAARSVDALREGWKRADGNLAESCDLGTSSGGKSRPRKSQNPYVIDQGLAMQKLGIALINEYPELSGKKIGFSRRSVGPDEGKVGGPLPRFLGLLFERVRGSLEAEKQARKSLDMDERFLKSLGLEEKVNDLAERKELSPSAETMASWIKLAKKVDNAGGR